MRSGCLLSVVFTVLSLAAIALLAFRPATLIGISEDALAKSIGDEAGAPRATCEGDDDRWTCAVGSPGDATRYRVSGESLGCWETERGGPARDELSGCVTLLDFID